MSQITTVSVAYYNKKLFSYSLIGQKFHMGLIGLKSMCVVKVVFVLLYGRSVFSSFFRLLEFLSSWTQIPFSETAIADCILLTLHHPDLLFRFPLYFQSPLSFHGAYLYNPESSP